MTPAASDLGAMRSSGSDFSPTHIIVGAGSSGCVMAGRLSEDPANRVLLIEAGSDHAPDDAPADISDTYAGFAFNNPAYFWPDLRMQRTGAPAGSPGVRYEQARVMGGGSSINGQVALRGAPRDFDRWEELGASGWNWDAVLPYFRKLESDRNFEDALHGRGGPIPIDRIAASQWDDFTVAITKNWETRGFARRRDMNGSFETGYAPIPLANDGRQRVSAAVGYLDSTVRRRANLLIWTDAEVRRIIMDGPRATAVEVAGRGLVQAAPGASIILCAGALHTPWLLLRAGIGPARDLQERGIQPVLDLAGVGRNLQDHPSISISAYLPRVVRRRPILRHNYVNLIYSSQARACPANDMVMMVVVKSAWHEVGKRLGTLSAYIGKTYSTGSVALDPADPHARPQVRFNWLDDERDLRRMADAFRFMSELLTIGSAPAYARDPFTTGFSDKIKKLGRITRTNRILTWLAANAMDSSALLRRQIISRFITGGLTIESLLKDPGALDSYLRTAVTGIWHPCGTCRMGAAGDPASVTDSRGQVLGSQNLFVADASLMPEIPTTNLNLPTLMVAERMADLMKARG